MKRVDYSFGCALGIEFAGDCFGAGLVAANELGAWDRGTIMFCLR